MDVGSFERLRDGEPWAGYRQFCTLFLYPLMLQAYRGIAPQPWLRGSLEGIEPAEARALLPRFRRGVLSHVSCTTGSRPSTPTGPRTCAPS